MIFSPADHPVDLVDPEARLVWSLLVGLGPRRAVLCPFRSGSLCGETPLLAEGSIYRFIPAHAGETPDSRTASSWAEVHPRACGEQVRCRCRVNPHDGSSPRMRGTEAHRDGRRAGQRFIPAHAGNRSRPVYIVSTVPVHPRACGEQGDEMNASRLRTRFIPAHAGNRLLQRLPPELSAVHPRACGEQWLMAPNLSLISGSSPRMRGTDSRTGLFACLVRFIPAHAGNSSTGTGTPSSRPVHPRACGEQDSHGFGAPAATGSSPRMRGTEVRPCASHVQRRFIPAHAGNS